MGYATVMRVPRIANYAEALKKYDNTKPIKGRSDEPRPLGDRRNVDTYSIRKNVWTDAIELVLYRTPVIKFTVEDEVIINIDNWPSASTCQFISRILFGVTANRVRGEVVLSFADGSRAKLPAKGELALSPRGDGRWVPKQKQILFDYRINRKGANNVRRRVSQFKDYLSGVVKLKADHIVQNEGHPYLERRFDVVKMTYAELIEVFGQQADINTNTRFRPNVDYWMNLDKKPAIPHAEVNWADYREITEKFYEIVRNDQDDNCRHQNYWLAFCILFALNNHLYWREDVNTWASLGTDMFETHLERVLFTMFSDEVFTRVQLPEGKVPTGKYDNYVRSEE